MARVVAVAAVLFGLVTLAAGARVLAGADPGYVVFTPLLIFNTGMGAAYVLAGGAIWKNARWGTGDTVAIDSVRAMAFRTAVWLTLFIVLLRARHSAAGAYS